VLTTALTIGACGGSNPAQPSLSTPEPLLPTSGGQIQFTSQPITLVVKNAVVTQSASVTYTFEIATDSAFASKVSTKDSVPAGTGGETSVTIGNLAAGTYYWHARAQQGGTTGAFGSAFSFTIGPNVTLAAPGLVAPANGAATEGGPVFAVTNVPSGAPVLYRFEVATSPSFDAILLTGTVAQGPGQTSFAPAPRVAPPTQPLFWRVTAIEQGTGTSSAASVVQTFTPFNTEQSNIAILQGLILWPGAQPPGTNGHARLGGNWNIETKTYIDGTRYLNPPLDELQVFDLIDRGLDPDSAIGWMVTHGYPTVAVWYSSVVVVGFHFQYMAGLDPATDRPSMNGVWSLVDRNE